MKGNMNIQRKY